MNNKIDRRTFAWQCCSAVLGVSALGGSSFGASVPSANPLSEKFLGQLPKMMEWSGVPGVQIAVVEKGRLIWKGNFGVSNSQTKEPVTDATVFQAASLSKPVFSYAVLMLHEEGKIDIDKPLMDYYPTEYIPDEPRARQITARHVMSHSSGLQNWRFQPNAKLQLAFSPGERYSYSGEGFYYLQRVVELITGTGLEQFMQERMLKPLGMKRSSYFWIPEYENALALGHTNRGVVRPTFGAEYIPKMLELAAAWNKPLGTWKIEDLEKAYPLIDPKLAVLPNFMTMNAAASLQTTVTDYAQFLIKMLEPSRRDKFGLKTETLREMFKPQTKINDAISWGTGVSLENQDKNSYFWHWGDNGTFRAFMLGEPARQWGIVILTNGFFGQRIWERVAREALNKEMASFLWV